MWAQVTESQDQKQNSTTSTAGNSALGKLPVQPQQTVVRIIYKLVFISYWLSDPLNKT